MTAWVLGLDGGGSKTALVYVSSDAEVCGPFTAPGINPFDRPGWEDVLRALLATHPAPGPLAHATLGLPGYGESPEMSARQERLVSDLVSAPVSVMNDVEAAFVGAFAGGPGVLLLAGTGSMAWAGDGERQVRAGGWGEGFGDEGSAYWLGRQALSLASQALDGRHPDRSFAGALLGPLLAGVDQTHLLEWYYALTHVRSQVAALARRVDELADQGQPTARALMQEGAAQLAAHVEAARRQLSRPDLPWSHAGSLLNSRTVLAALTGLLGAPTPPRLSPLVGAVFHAARQAGFEAGPAWERQLGEKLSLPPVLPASGSSPIGFLSLSVREPQSSHPFSRGTFMNKTTRSIQEQFPYWEKAAAPALSLSTDQQHVLVGCGTSYYLAQSVAAALNEAGVPSLAVPGSEWLSRPEAYLNVAAHPHVLALSRSGESTETVQAAVRSRAAGLSVTALTCEAGSSLAQNADHVLYSQTHPEEGIVMTASASLMLLSGLRLAGLRVGEPEIAAAQALLEQSEGQLPALIAGRSHFVFLGGGQLYGVAQEGALKLQEMSLSYTQAYHPMEYRHGPVSLVDERTLVVMLYHPDTRAEEEKLVRELRDKGARVLGLGGAGDLSFELTGDANLRALTVLPTLQMLGESVASSKGLDSEAPRWLTKVVTLA